MIYFISDIHADIRFKGLQEYLKTATDDDLLIVLGDVGLQFENTEENRAFTKAFLSSKKKIAFLDGNHENFAYLNGFPTEEWNGGKVHRLSENVV
ncbi:MAG: metallophosphoesterase, partial [Clostridia bacterium]|nr:metallophosphoesterase [Clostridia bacterium]